MHSKRLRQRGMWRALHPWFRRFLLALGCVWALLACVAIFFPITSRVAMLALGFGVPLAWVGFPWLIIISVQDGVWLWIHPRSWPRWFAYLYGIPERTAKPWSLAMLGAVTCFSTFALLLVKENFPNPFAPRPPGLVKPVAAPAPEVRPPVRHLFEQGPRTYLSDMEEFDVKPGPWPLGKNGNVGDGRAITVNGQASPRGLGMHPPDLGYSAVKYRLGKQAALFKAAVALNDTTSITNAGLFFEVLGDGQQLWQSAPIRQAGQPEECMIDVSGVDVLELRAHALGSHLHLHAVWIEPRVLQKANPARPLKPAP